MHWSVTRCEKNVKLSEVRRGSAALQCSLFVFATRHRARRMIVWNWGKIEKVAKELKQICRVNNSPHVSKARDLSAIRVLRCSVRSSFYILIFFVVRETIAQDAVRASTRSGLDLTARLECFNCIRIISKINHCMSPCRKSEPLEITRQRVENDIVNDPKLIANSIGA